MAGPAGPPARLGNRPTPVNGCPQRILIWDFNNDPGLVPARPFSSSRLRSPPRRRSIVAADIAHILAVVGMVTMPARQLAQFVQDHRFGALGRRPIPGRGRPRNRLALAYRQSHVRGCPDLTASSCQPRRHAGIIDEATKRFRGHLG